MVYLKDSNLLNKTTAIIIEEAVKQIHESELIMKHGKFKKYEVWEWKMQFLNRVTQLLSELYRELFSCPY